MIISNLLGALSLFALCLGLVLTVGIMKGIMNSCFPAQRPFSFDCNDIECGDNQEPSFRKIAAICTALDFSLDELQRKIQSK